MLFLLLACKFSLSDCTYQSNLISIEDNSSIAQLKDEYRPSFLRLTSPGCPYSPLSQSNWEYAAQLFPQVNFVTINCWENTAICSLFGDSINTPYHAYVLANTSELFDNADTQFGRIAGSTGNKYDIDETPNKFIDVITRYSHLYPLAPPLAQLVPMVTDSFYKNAENPIILTYNSQCSEEIQFVSAWAKAANEQLSTTSDHLRIGLLDCSQFGAECQRWSRPYTVKTPRALIFSSKTGNFEILQDYASITSDQIDGIVQNLDFMPNKPMPTPIPDSDQSSSTLSPGDYTVLENNELQNRKLEDVKQRYMTDFKKADGDGCDGGCGGKEANAGTCYNYQPNPNDVAAALKVINLFRWFAGLSDSVVEDKTWSTGCTKTAMNMHKSRRVPPDHKMYDLHLTSQYCGEAGNKQIALDSLLSQNTMTSFESAYKLIQDEGANNDGVVGHRRYLFHPNLQKVGIGFYPFKEKIEGVFHTQYPAVSVIRIRENNNLQYMENSVPSNLKFISWPSAGPFPIKHLPSNWHISHPSFRNVEVSDLEIQVTREDGMVLPISRATIEKESINKDALILIMSAEALEKCQATHTITVRVKDNKNHNFIQFSFELFDDQAYTEVCFYNNDQSKCPASSTAYGPQQYASCPALSSATNIVHIHVAEPITLTQPLSFTATRKFIITGSTISGTIKIAPNVVIDFQDPTQTDFEIEWKTLSRTIGKLDTAKKAKSILVNVADANETANSNKLVFYTGRETSCSLSKSVFRGSSRDVYYSFGGSNYQCIVIASPIEAYENFLVGENVFDSYEELKQDYPGTTIQSLYDMKNQVAYKRVVRVFFKTEFNQYIINLTTFIPNIQKDYVFIVTGGSYNYVNFECDLDINKVASSFTLQDLSYRYGTFPPIYTFQIMNPTGKDKLDRQRCPIKHVSIINAKYHSVMTNDLFFPSVLADETAKNRYPLAYSEIIEATSNTVDTIKSGSKNQANIILNKDHEDYTIKLQYEGNNLYKYLTFYPKEGDESAKYTLTFKDRGDSSADPFDGKFPLPADIYFENFQNLAINHPMSQKYMPQLHFINSKVSFKSQEGQQPIQIDSLDISSSIDYGLPITTNIVSSTEEGRFELPNVETKNLTVSNHQEFVSLKITDLIELDSSHLILNSCEISDAVNIIITKSSPVWPVIAFVNTKVIPNQINVDLGISSASSKLLADNEEPYEQHILISNVDSNDCETIKGKTTLANYGKFELKCDLNKTNIVVTKGTPPQYEIENDDEDIDGPTTPTPDINPDNTPPPPPLSDGGKKSLPAGAIAGIVIAVLVVVAAVVVGVVFYLRRRSSVVNKHSSSDVDIKEATMESNNVTGPVN